MPKEDLNEMMSRLKMASLKQPGMINVRLELNPINGQMRIDIPQNPMLVLGMLDMARAHVYSQITGQDKKEETVLVSKEAQS